MADKASRAAIERAGIEVADVDLLLNTGLYHDRNLGEPALAAALIQEDVGINPEDPRGGPRHLLLRHRKRRLRRAESAAGRGRFLAVRHHRSRPGGGERRRSRPWHGTGLPVLGQRRRDRVPLGGRTHRPPGFRWEMLPKTAISSATRVRFEGGRNLLRVEQDPEFGSLAAAYAGKTAKSLLADHEIKPEDVDLVVANPLTAAFLEALSEHMGMGAERFVAVAGAEHVHTAALLVAVEAAEEQGRLGEAHRVLLVSAGAGIVVGAAMLVR